MTLLMDAQRAGVERYAPWSLTEFGEALERDSLPTECDWSPLFVVLAPGERAQLDALASAQRFRCVNEIARQIDDFAAICCPSPAQASERASMRAEVDAMDGGTDVLGAWVWFGWMRTLVHLLPPDAYFAVITNRNHDKITVEEQALLRSKRIGVMGLSVGGEAAVTVAQEHLCGEIVIADFDRLDLSNLNRLHAGVDELGHNKAHIVARRIARIDPYLRVTVFSDGITTENLPTFMRGLDLLLEECDGLPIKHAAREWAMRERLNVTYAADENGFLSVEPYGNMAELPMFHGRLTEPPKPRSAYPSTEAFYRALTEWLGGWDRISERSRQSLLALETRLCGYPQLASEARFAAGSVGHVARRLLLGEQLAPALYFFDLQSLVRSA